MLILLALSQVLSFDAAYWTGAAAATLMVSLHAIKALTSRRQALAAAAGLGTVCGFFFVVLKLQDFSLVHDGYDRCEVLASLRPCKDNPLGRG